MTVQPLRETIIGLGVECDPLGPAFPEGAQRVTQQQRADAAVLVSRIHCDAIEMGRRESWFLPQFPFSVPHYFARHFCHGEVGRCSSPPAHRG